ncbi:MAG: hypothetical protein ABI882_03580 [Acidobacteriota bacterium]
MKTFLIGIKNVLLWSYLRGSWQYDLLCLLIVAAVFLVPSSFFGDRDRSQHQSGAGVSAENSREEMIEAETLRALLAAKNIATTSLDFPDEAIVMYLHERCRCEVALVRPSEMVSDSQGRTGYRVWFRTK